MNHAVLGAVLAAVTREPTPLRTIAATPALDIYSVHHVRNALRNLLGSGLVAKRVDTDHPGKDIAYYWVPEVADANPA